MTAGMFVKKVKERLGSSLFEQRHTPETEDDREWETMDNEELYW